MAIVSARHEPLIRHLYLLFFPMSQETIVPPRRHRLPEERRAIIHKFQVGSHEGYITVGLYDDTRMPGEIFIRMSKDKAEVSGMIDAFATSISIGLQYGVPLKVFAQKFINMKFEPSGATQNPNIPAAKSIMDYIFRWLALKFLTPEERQAVGLFGEDTHATAAARPIPVYTEQPRFIDNASSGPMPFDV